MPEVSVAQCILFLLPNYHNVCTMSEASIRACRPNVVRNHYITLQQLNGMNPNLGLSSIFCGEDAEHILVVERALVHALKSLVRFPILYIFSVAYHAVLPRTSTLCTMRTTAFRRPSKW